MPYQFNALSGKFDIVSSGSGSPTDSFTIIQPDHGTSPTASSSSDTLTLTSSDSSVTITGNSGAKSVNFQVANASPTWTDYTSYTNVIQQWDGTTTFFSATLGTTTTNLAYYRRIGDSLDLYIQVDGNGSGTTSSSGKRWVFSLPTGLTVNTGKFSGIGTYSRALVGIGACWTNSTGNNYLAHAYMASSSTIAMIAVGSSFTDIGDGQVPITTGFEYRFSLKINGIPITGWT